jgi:phosphoserine phosphatase
MTGKKPRTIIWDFDGTLLPNDPYDSEQSLMLYKLQETGEKVPVVIHALARILLYADQKEFLRKVFKRFYIRLMRGTSKDIFDPVCQRLAAKISEADRDAVMQLAYHGHHMIVLSCGTANLSEKTLQMAGLGGCFEIIAGNRFESENGKIRDMTLHIPNPEDKVRFLNRRGIERSGCIAIGDGYTDIPMLDWAAISVLVDRTGRKQIKYAHKNYRFVRSLPEIVEIVSNSMG